MNSATASRWMRGVMLGCVGVCWHTVAFAVVEESPLTRLEIVERLERSEIPLSARDMHEFGSAGLDVLLELAFPIAPVDAMPGTTHRPSQSAIDRYQSLYTDYITNVWDHQRLRILCHHVCQMMELEIDKSDPRYVPLLATIRVLYRSGVEAFIEPVEARMTRYYRRHLGDVLFPLHDAARQSDQETVDAWIATGADVNERDDTGSTPLHRTSSASVANLLLDAGADPNLVSPLGKSPLGWALIMGRESLAETIYAYGGQLLPDGVTVHDDDGERLSITRHEAIFTSGKMYSARRSLDEVLAAIDQRLYMGADLLAVKESGDTALHALVRYRKPRPEPELLRLFVNAGVPINARRNYDGKTALHYARDGETIRNLLELGAEVTVDEHGNTLLHSLVRHCRKAPPKRATLSMLAKMGISVNARNRRGRTAIDYARHATTAQNLVELGAHASDRNEKYASRWKGHWNTLD